VKNLEEKKKDNSPNAYLKYSGLGLQFFITIGICGWLGYKMDQWWRQGRPLFIIIMIFVGFIGGFYQLIKATRS